MKATKDTIKVRGFFRLQITEDRNGREHVVGDSGWLKNQVVNLGFQDYLVETLGGIAGSKQITHVALGTGGAPSASATALAGEIMSSTQRGTVSPSVIASKTLQMTRAFASSDSFLTASANLSNVGLYNTSTAGTLFAGNTFASSAAATNQNVNVTYQIRFS